MNESDLKSLEDFSKSWYLVITNFEERRKVKVTKLEIEVNGVDYDFYYIPFKESLNEILSNAIILHHLFEWHTSRL